MLHCTYIQVHQPDYWSSLKSLFRFSPLFPRKNTEPSQEYIFSSSALQDKFYLLLPKLQTKWKLPNSFFKLVKTCLEGPVPVPGDYFDILKESQNIFPNEHDGMNLVKVTHNKPTNLSSQIKEKLDLPYSIMEKGKMA